MRMKKVKKVFQKNVTTVDAKTGEILKDVETTTTITKQATEPFIKIFHENLKLEHNRYLMFMIKAVSLQDDQYLIQTSRFYDLLVNDFGLTRASARVRLNEMIKSNLFKTIKKAHVMLNSHLISNVDQQKTNKNRSIYQNHYYCGN